MLMLLTLALTFPAHGRWAEPSEVASKVNFERVRYKVRADGTYRVVVRQL